MKGSFENDETNKFGQKILQSKVMSDDELENVADGIRLETYADGEELYKRGFSTEEQADHSTPVRELLHKMGFSLICPQTYPSLENPDDEAREEFKKN